MLIQQRTLLPIDYVYKLTTTDSSVVVLKNYFRKTMLNIKLRHLSINERMNYIKENMFDLITDEDNTLEAYYNTQKGKPRLKKSAMAARRRYTRVLTKIVNDIKNGTYVHNGYIIFTVKEPKIRLVYAPTYVDKVVQHMINNILREYYEPKFIYDSYACIRERGNKAATMQLQHQLKQANKEYRNPYYLKLDISKFFYTIDRAILKEILRKEIKCEKTLALLDIIIDSFVEPLGLPLGNLTSQLFANIYLNEIDKFIKDELKIKYYLRYADDMFFILEDFTEASRLRDLIIKLIFDKLKLIINPKKVIIKPATDIAGLGFIIRKTHIDILRKNRIGFRVLLKKENINSLNSWYGYAGIAKCKIFVYRELIKYGKNRVNYRIRFRNNKFTVE